MKLCCTCSIFKSLDFFPKKKEARDGYASSCKVCKNIQAGIIRKTKIEYHRKRNSEYGLKTKNTDKAKTRNSKKCKVYRENHPEKFRFYANTRRALKLKATPSWASLKKIEMFYLACPVGLEVDHIIPLKGKTVCGLHVETNLQYLTPSENRSKSNKFYS